MPIKGSAPLSKGKRQQQQQMCNIIQNKEEATFLNFLAVPKNPFTILIVLLRFKVVSKYMSTLLSYTDSTHLFEDSKKSLTRQ